jgi:molybdate transport system permease protein
MQCPSVPVPIPFVAALAIVFSLGAGMDSRSVAAPSASSSETLVVSAASSLSDVLAELARGFEREHGGRVLVNVAGSNSLARQIVAGAPVDLFISADVEQMRLVEVAGRIEAGSRTILVSNRLVVMADPARAFRIRTVGDLLDPGVRRIAVGDPTAVPVGVYTRRYLESLGLWARIEPKIAPGVSVRAALAMIDNGEADAAFVYRTDAAMAKRAIVAFEVPPSQAPPIDYPAAVVAGSRHGDLAHSFLGYLRLPASASTFGRFGFLVPDGTGQTTPAAPSPGTPATAVDWTSLWGIGLFTAGVALGATALMLPPAIIVAWLLARGRFHGKVILETLVSLPLVLPPVATGLVLLHLLGRRGPFGAVLASGRVDIVFTWKAVVIAMAVMGFPLVARTARAGFEQVTRRYEQVAETLGAGPMRVFFTISLPLASRDVLAGALLGFSRALGEFGATIVVAGSLPGRTRTIAVAMFNFIETGQDGQAGVLLVGSVLIAFTAVWASNLLVRGRA